MKKKIIIFIFIFFSIHIVSVTANTEGIIDKQQKFSKQDTLVLGLDECIEYALKNNYNASISKQNFQLAEAQYQQAMSAYWPQLMLNSSYTRLSDAPNFIFPAQPMNLGSQSLVFAQSIANAQLAQQGITPTSLPGGLAAFNAALEQATQDVLRGLNTTPMPAWDVKIMEKKSFVNSLNWTYPLYTGGKINAAVKQAKAGIDAAALKIKKTDLQIIHDVKKYYYACVLTEKLMNIGQTALERMEATLELTENLYQKGSGRIKKTDFLRNKIMVEGVRSAVSLVDGNAELARLALADMLGLSYNVTICVKDKELPFKPCNFELEKFISGAYQFNPDWNMLKAGLCAAEEKIDEEKSGNLPKIGLFGSLNYINNSYASGIMSDENKKNWTAGIGMEFKIFDGMLTKNKIKEARARLKKMQKEQLLAENGIAVMIKNIFISLNTCNEQEKSIGLALQAAIENCDLNTRAYQEELVETQDVIEAQLLESFIQAQYQKIIFDNIEAFANLELIVGTEINKLFD